MFAELLKSMVELALASRYAYTFFFVKIGYEPADPTPYKTFLGKEMFRLPGLFSYGKHLSISPIRIKILSSNV